MQTIERSQNYKLALEKQLVPFGLWITNLPATKSISEDLYCQLNSVLYDNESV